KRKNKTKEPESKSKPQKKYRNQKLNKDNSKDNLIQTSSELSYTTILTDQEQQTYIE
ncbi:5884_t:CDS:1, partial [Scutellospora calospora]